MKSGIAFAAMLALLAGLSQVAHGREDSFGHGGFSIGINGAACAFNTLDQAIQAASSGDTIFIQPSTRTEFIGKIGIDLTFVPAQAGPPTLSGCEQELASATSASVIIDAGGGSDDTVGGIAEIERGAEVTFRHMWLRNAQATYGGILAVTGVSTLILDDVLVTDGTASRDGGNIYVSSGTASPSTLRLINDTSVYRGTAVDGGAVALLNSDLFIVDGNIGVSSNNGFSVASNDGGGIHAVNSSIDMSSNQSRIIWNQSGHYGGGVYAIGSAINIDDSILSNNTAITSGGGIYLSDSTMTMRDATLEANSATVQSTNEGGGALNMVAGSFAQIRNTDFIDNQAANTGGAIQGREGTTLQLLENSELVGNSASNGGAISARGETLIGRTLIEGNQASNLGGGIWCFVCTTLIVNDFSTVRANSARSGGGISVTGGSGTLVDFHRTLISQNEATGLDSGYGNGGGLSINKGVLSISDSQFEQNSAALDGGGLFASRTTGGELSATLDSVEFVENVTTDSSTNQGGAGALFENMDQVSIVDSVFELNESNNIGGGAMILASDDVQVSSTSFLGNTGSLGGGLYSTNSELLVDRNTYFDSNIATIRGGGLYAFGNNSSGVTGTVLRNVEVFGNQAVYGAGIALSFNSHEFFNVRIRGNVAEVRGGGIEISRSSGLIASDLGELAGKCDPFALPGNRYCAEISNNSAGEFGGGVYFTGDAASSGNGIMLRMLAITDNQALLGGSAIYAAADEEATISLQNALVANNGSPIDESSVIEVLNDEELILDSVTIAGNFGSPLVATDTLSSVQLNRSILHQNSVGPLVEAGVPFQRFCNNSQATSGNSQSMGGSLGDPNFTLTARGDFRLPGNSVSVDACPDGPDNDLDGLLRPNSGGTHDQGAFEFGGVLPPSDVIFADGFEA